MKGKKSMKKIMRKGVAYLCAITMVTGSLTGLKTANVGADMTTTVLLNNTDARTALIQEAKNEDYNFALGKNVDVSSAAVGNAGGTDTTIITNGAFATARNTTTTVSVGYGVTGDKWVQVDLGKAYDTAKIDRVAVQYFSKNTSTCTANKKGYSIQYSLDGTSFVEVGSVAAGVDLGASGNYFIYLDTITLTEEQAQEIPYAKYVRVYANEDTNLKNNGLQVMGMAVLTDGTTKVSEVSSQEVATLDNAASLTVTSSDYEQLEYSFEAAAGDEGDYTYYVSIDGTQQKEPVEPNKNYVVTGLTSGSHMVKIVSQKDEVLSTGITETVTIASPQNLLTDERNIALGKTAKSSSIRENDLETNITDGNLTSLFRTVTTDTNSTIVIDLGQYYRTDAIERTVAYYSKDRYPKNYTIDYSMNGVDFETVATAEGNADVQTVAIDSEVCTLQAVRYVRFNLSNPVTANFGFQMYELGVIVKEDADLTPVEVATVNNPAAFDVEVTGYDKATATITAGENQENYTYNIYIDNELVLKEVAAGTYELTDIPAGNKSFTVKSVAEGIVSEGITVTKEIKSAFIYTYETLENSVVEAAKSIDTEKTDGDTTYYNYSLYKGVKVSASSEENALNTADKAIDGDNTTRWASEQGVDPQWYQVDLGGAYKIDELDIIWQNSSAKDFSIEVSENGTEFTKLGIITSAAANSRYDNIKLTDEITARYVRITGTARNTAYGYSIWELGIYGPEELKTVYYNVSVDGVEETVEEGKEYTLPSTAQYGYYADNAMYKAGATVTVESDMTFTSVNELSITTAKGAGIRIEGSAGIRFQAKITTDNEDALNSTAITEGMLITANDLYENLGNNTLDLTSTYTVKNIVNSGWYNNQLGTYCGSIVGINEANYIRKFIARAYVTINYQDGSAVTYYSGMTDVRSIQYVAQAIKNAGYAGIAEDYISVVEKFAQAK
jgi:hypothetical protein